MWGGDPIMRVYQVQYHCRTPGGLVVESLTHVTRRAILPELITHWSRGGYIYYLTPEDKLKNEEAQDLSLDEVSSLAYIHINKGQGFLNDK
jgi:hypothetical protein